MITANMTQRPGYCMDASQASNLINVISLGAGVQSSVMALMAAQGIIKPMPVLAIFADTGYEPKAVYRWLDYLTTQLPFPVVRVSKGNLKQDQLAGRVLGTKGSAKRYISLPFFTLDPSTGKVGHVRRQCTREYKIRPIERCIRERLLHVPYYKHVKSYPQVVQWRGISADEASRMRPSDKPWLLARYPLALELTMTRGDCVRWARKHGYPAPPRSACLCCPFHSDSEWLRIKRSDEWQDVVAFDAAIRHKGGIRGQLFLHKACKPLDKVPFQDHGAGFWPEECAGYCGV